MVNANIQIIQELSKFLEAVSVDPATRSLFTRSKQDFTRERVLTLQRVAGIILNMPKRSLSIEVREFLTSLSCSESCSKAAFSMQRSKLKPEFFAELNALLVRLFYQYYGDKVAHWRGYLVYAVDGSRVYLPQKEEVAAHFGVQDNQHVSVPMAQAMQIQDILNDITIWGDIYPVKTSEQSIISSKINYLPADSITLFDRGYPSYALLFLMQQQSERKFVMRCKVGFNNEVKKFMNSRKTDIISYFTPTETAQKTLHSYGYTVSADTKLKVRLVKIRLASGLTEVLMTNLYDKSVYSVEDLSYLYSIRWGIETCYGKEKNQVQPEQFSGHRVVCIKQDYYALLCVCNLQSLIEKQSEGYLSAVSRRRKYRYKINRNTAWAAMKNTLFKLFITEHPQQILLYLQHLFELCLEAVRPNRKYERKKKVNRINGKYQTLTNYKRAI